ncbi:hypothetical protein HS048_14845 [Planomonospora sp. ID91781]|uniref:Uncharacterized protein n=1 Tax=Planomonospora sphaerica TaxID=161355 RepID=A0A171BAV7_9ACTN|nr:MULTISPECIES: hypothetical protein [Planomonospora]MBG0822017.1 hypothetical protein [Planomonospora sp. ID91781]GAT64858.1 hypothetical protein PS9374_00490 [Planomonospora sphaerica]
MAKSGNTGNVFDLGELRRLVDELGTAPREARAAVLDEAVAGDAGDADCDCPSCGTEALSFPPVELAPDAELARAVLRVPLVRDARRLAAWTGTRQVTPECLLPDPFLAAAELGLPGPARVHLLWVVAVNTGMLRISRGTAAPGPLVLTGDLPPRALLEFWDGVVMDVLDRADESLTGSAVVDEHLAEMLATMYAVSDGLSPATLVKGILQSHEVACEARPAQMRQLAASLPGELAAALDLLGYCGLVERSPAGWPRLTPLGVWAVRQDLMREGHDAPTGAEVAVFADLGAGELVEAIVKGSAAPSAVTVWLESRGPETAARELLGVAASGAAGQRGVVSTILEELGPEAETPVREALAEPSLWRYAASWLHIRDLPAPTLTPADNTWIAVDTLASLIHQGRAPEGMGEFAALEPGEDLVRLVEEMALVEHPDAIVVLDMLGAHHADAAVAKAARKAVMKARSR